MSPKKNRKKPAATKLPPIDQRLKALHRATQQLMGGLLSVYTWSDMIANSSLKEFSAETYEMFNPVENLRISFLDLMQKRDDFHRILDRVDWHIIAASGKAVRARDNVYHSWHAAIDAITCGLIKHIQKVSVLPNGFEWMADKTLDKETERFDLAMIEKKSEKVAMEILQACPTVEENYELQAQLRIEFAVAMRTFCSDEIDGIDFTAEPQSAECSERRGRPMTIEQKSKLAVSAKEHLAVSLGRKPTREEIAKELMKRLGENETLSPTRISELLNHRR